MGFLGNLLQQFDVAPAAADAGTTAGKRSRTQSRSGRSPASTSVSREEEHAYADEHPGGVAWKGAFHLVLWNFDVGESEPRPEHLEALDKLVERIAGRSNMTEIQGHASVTGPGDGNSRLAIQRAMAIRQALSGRGVSTAFTVPFSSIKPWSSEDTPSGLAHNRRVELIVRWTDDKAGPPSPEAEPSPASAPKAPPMEPMPCGEARLQRDLARTEAIAWSISGKVPGMGMTTPGATSFTPGNPPMSRPDYVTTQVAAGGAGLDPSLSRPFGLTFPAAPIDGKWDAIRRANRTVDEYQDILDSGKCKEGPAYPNQFRFQYDPASGELIGVYDMSNGGKRVAGSQDEFTALMDRISGKDR